MKSFGEELRDIRDTYEMTVEKFSERVGIHRSTYYALETGTVSAQSKSAKKVVRSSKLTQFERLLLKKAIEKEEKTTKIVITDADRLVYRKRKNEQYAREKGLKKEVGREFSRAIPKTMTQKIFY